MDKLAVGQIATLNEEELWYATQEPFHTTTGWLDEVGWFEYSYCCKMLQSKCCGDNVRFYMDLEDDQNIQQP